MTESIVRLMALDKHVPGSVGHDIYRSLMTGGLRVPTLRDNVLPMSFQQFHPVHVSAALERLEAVFNASINRHAENLA